MLQLGYDPDSATINGGDHKGKTLAELAQQDDVAVSTAAQKARDEVLKEASKRLIQKPWVRVLATSRLTARISLGSACR